VDDPKYFKGLCEDYPGLDLLALLVVHTMHNLRLQCGKLEGRNLAYPLAILWFIHGIAEGLAYGLAMGFGGADPR
jgi:hypothetical protein